MADELDDFFSEIEKASDEAPSEPSIGSEHSVKRFKTEPVEGTHCAN